MNKYRIEIKWAVIFIIVTLVWMYAEKFVGLHDKYIDKHQIYTNFFAIPAIAIYVLAFLDKRKNYYGGTLTYLQGFRCGLIITIILTVVAPLSQYIISVYITPDYFNNVINYLVSHQKMDMQEAQKAFNLNTYIWQSVIGTLVMGVITTAIVALIVRRRPVLQQV